MPTETQIFEALRKVMDPELGRNIVELGMVHDLDLSAEHKVAFTLALTVPGCPLRDQIAGTARSLLMTLPGVADVVIAFRAMTDEERKKVFGSSQPPLPRLTNLNQVKATIAVMSGKGGVGKSLVTALLAAGLVRQGKKVGILDADITGPSIPKLFGLPPGGLRGTNQGMLPAVTRSGIKVVSSNLLLKESDAPVVWRGTMIASAIKQFWTDALWGKLDALLVDMPPGTSDAALSVLQNLPVSGVVLVTTPQDLAALVVRKAVHMLNEMKMPIVGLVENMSYYTCPDCGARHEIFGPSHLEELSQAICVPILGRLPVDPTLAELADAGRMEEASLPELVAVVERVAVAVP